MKQKAIDGTVPNPGLALYEPPTVSSDLTVDFLSSSVLEEIEAGIKKIQDAGDILALVQGIAIVKIERDGLWMQAGYHSLQSYRTVQNKRLGISRQTVTRRRAAADGYLSFRRELSGFPLSGHVEKLRYLPAAVKRLGKKAAIASFKEMSFREFEAVALPPKEIPALPSHVSWDAHGVEVDKVQVLQWSDQFKEREWLGEIIQRAFNAEMAGNKALVLEVYDSGEARAVENFLKKLRASR